MISDLPHIENLSISVSKSSMAQENSGKNNNGKKRSATDAFLEECQHKDSATKKSTRLELARAKNRREKSGKMFTKSKERVQEMIGKLREKEADYEAACNEVARLEALLKDDV